MVYSLSNLNRNPLAVICLSRDEYFTFLENSIKCLEKTLFYRLEVPPQ